MIKGIALNQNQCGKFLLQVNEAASLGLIGYAIYLLAIIPMGAATMGVIIGYIVIEFFLHLQIFLCLIFVALIPLLCVFICFYACCCASQKKAELPNPVSATVEMINATDDATCTICFRSFTIGEEIIILPCSPKHIFHPLCIRNWVIVKPNCPICRHDLF